MFSNYINGAIISSHGHCGHHHTNLTPAVSVKDAYGNVVKLQWTPIDRFSVDITSNSWIPVLDDSIILNQSGQTPYDVAGVEGRFAYNTSDYRCWKFSKGGWEEQSEIASQDAGKTIMLFSNKSGLTRIVLKNFRGEPVHTAESIGDTVTLTIDDALSEKLLQGYYNMYVYLVSGNTTKFIRKISVSVGNYVEESAPPHGHHCHGPNIVPPNCNREEDEHNAWLLNRAMISVSTISERDSLDCPSLPHGKVVRVAHTDSGAKYYSWNQVTYTWKEEMVFNGNSGEIISENELDELLSELKQTE